MDSMILDSGFDDQLIFATIPIHPFEVYVASDVV